MEEAVQLATATPAVRDLQDDCLAARAQAWFWLAPGSNGDIYPAIKRPGTGLPQHHPAAPAEKPICDPHSQVYDLVHDRRAPSDRPRCDGGEGAATPGRCALHLEGHIWRLPVHNEVHVQGNHTPDRMSWAPIAAVIAVAINDVVMAGFLTGRIPYIAMKDKFIHVV